MKKVFFILGLFGILVSSCQKFEGEGGKSSITGKIFVTERLYVQSNLSDSIQYPGATEDVYIVYGGDGDVPDDRVECGYDGTFRFDYLQPGTYTIYSYSEIFDKGSNISNNEIANSLNLQSLFSQLATNTFKVSNIKNNFQRQY